MPYLLVEEYAGVAEFSVYVAPHCHGQGGGSPAHGGRGARRPVQDDKPRLRSDHASRAMLAHAGFREVGTHLRHVRAADGWRDVVIVEALFGDARTGDLQGPPAGSGT